MKATLAPVACSMSCLVFQIEGKSNFDAEAACKTLREAMKGRSEFELN